MRQIKNKIISVVLATILVTTAFSAVFGCTATADTATLWHCLEDGNFPLADDVTQVNGTDKGSLTELSEIGDYVLTYADGTKQNVSLYIKGDVTGDGLIDICDLVDADELVGGITNGFLGAGAAADVNSDNVTDGRDITIMRQYLLGVVNEFAPITYKDMLTSGANNGVNYSHGGMSSPSAYPYWSYYSISLSDENDIKPLVKDTSNSAYVAYRCADDTTAHFRSNTTTQTGKDYDLVCAYTMPCKAKINLSIKAAVTSYNGTTQDGEIVSCYVNNTDNAVIDRTLVKNTGDAQVIADAIGITLNKGDVIYFRLNKNKNATKDAGPFYARIDYLDEEPDEVAFTGTPINNPAWFEMSGSAPVNTAQTCKAKDTACETVSIDLATGEEKPLVLSTANNADMKVDGATDSGDTGALLRVFNANQNGLAYPAKNYDLAYVYTMPCTAKVNLGIRAGFYQKVDGDGLVVSCYVNNTDHALIDRTIVPNTEVITVAANVPQVASATAVTLNKGDKIYFRLNKNANQTSDTSWFFGTVEFLNVKPDATATAGHKLSTLTLAEFKAKGNPNNNVHYSNGSLSSPTSYPCWEAVVLNKDGSEKPLVKDTSVASPVTYRAEGDKASYLDSSGHSMPASANDMAYVFTAPCDMSLRATLQACVTDYEEGRTDGTNDGVTVYAYVNNARNMFIPRTLITNTENKNIKSVNLNVKAGDRLYFCLNKNIGRTGDAGMFVARLENIAEYPVNEKLVALTDLSGKIRVVSLGDRNATVDDTDTVWQFEPTAALGYTLAMERLSEGVNDVRLRHDARTDKDVVLITSSNNWVGIADYATGNCLAEIDTGENIAPHAVEMLPDGSFVVACTGDEQNENDGCLLHYTYQGGTYVAERIALVKAHGVAWDNNTNTLWALGVNEITAFAYNDGKLEAITGKTYELPDESGHDLVNDATNANRMYVSTKNHIYLFDKTTGEFITNYPYADKLYNNYNVKGIASFADGSFAFCSSNNANFISYGADTFYTVTAEASYHDTLGQLNAYTFDGVAFYKVRNFAIAY